MELGSTPVSQETRSRVQNVAGHCPWPYLLTAELHCFFKVEGCAEGCFNIAKCRLESINPTTFPEPCTGWARNAVILRTLIIGCRHCAISRTAGDGGEGFIVKTSLVGIASHCSRRNTPAAVRQLAAFEWRNKARRARRKRREDLVHWDRRASISA